MILFGQGVHVHIEESQVLISYPSWMFLKVVWIMCTPTPNTPYSLPHRYYARAQK